jgi:hypothetical protein
VFNNSGHSNFNPESLLIYLFTLCVKLWCANCVSKSKISSHYNALVTVAVWIAGLTSLTRERRPFGPEGNNRANAAAVWRFLVYF